MTDPKPSERDREVALTVMQLARRFDAPGHDPDELKDGIAQALATARAEERERDAMLMDAMARTARNADDEDVASAFDTLAAAIRARGARDE